MTDEEHLSWLKRIADASESGDIDPSVVLRLQLAVTMIQYIEHPQNAGIGFTRDWLNAELKRIEINGSTRVSNACNP